MSKIKELQKGYFKDKNQEIEKIYFNFNDKNYLLKKETKVFPNSNGKKGTEINLYEIPKLQITGYRTDIEGNKIFNDKLDSFEDHETREFEKNSRKAFYFENELIDTDNKIGNFGNLSEDLQEELSHYLGEKIAKLSLEKSRENKNKEIERENVVIADPSEEKNWTYENIISSFVDEEGLLNIENNISYQNSNPDIFHSEKYFAQTEAGWQNVALGIVKLKNEEAINEIRQIFNKDNNTNLSKTEFLELCSNYEIIFDEELKIEKASNKYVNSKIDFSFLKVVPAAIKNKDFNKETVEDVMNNISFKTFEEMCKQVENSDLFKESTHKRKILLTDEFPVNTPIFDGKYNGNYLKDKEKIFSFNQDAKELKINTEEELEDFGFEKEYLTFEYSKENLEKFKKSYEYDRNINVDYYRNDKSDSKQIFEMMNDLTKEDFSKLFNSKNPSLEKLNGNYKTPEKFVNDLEKDKVEEVVNKICDGNLKKEIKLQLENISQKIEKQNQKVNEMLPEVFENLIPNINPKLAELGSNLNEYQTEETVYDVGEENENFISLNFDDFQNQLTIKTEYNDNLEEFMLKKLTYSSKGYDEEVVLFDEGESYSYIYEENNPLYAKKIKNTTTLNEDNTLNSKYLIGINNLLGNIENNINEITIENERLVVDKNIINAIRNYEVIRNDGTKEKLGNIIDKNNKVFEKQNDKKIKEKENSKEKFKKNMSKAQKDYEKRLKNDSKKIR